MSIEFRCNQCGQLLRVPDDSGGKHARCPKCQALMAVPLPATGEVPMLPPAAELAAEPAPLALAPAPTLPDPVSPPADVPGESPFGPGPTTANGGKASVTSNPFGEAVGENPFGGPATANLNPYASPATLASYQPVYDAAGQRIGLPWDTDRRTFGCWFRTVRLILGMPSQAFTIMHRTGGLGRPIWYSIYGIGMPAAAAMALVMPIVLLVLSEEIFRDVGVGGAILGGLGILAAVALYVVLIATLGNLIAAAIWHLFLMMVGGAKHSFETTFRVTSYVYGSMMALTALPYVGCAAYIWMMVLLVIGLAKAHETSTGKAMLAVLLPVGVCVGGYFLMVFSFLLGPVFFDWIGG
jgi:phage FluMu protein Com